WALKGRQATMSPKCKTTGTAVYGTVRTVVWEDGGREAPSYPIFPATRIINFVKTLEDIKSTLSRHRMDMSENFRVKDTGVFGSFVRGEAKEDSDVDIIVTFSAPIGLLRFLSLEEYSKGLLGLKVDLVSKDALKPRIGARILKEVVYV
ncbi:MAG: nucleotidyltransferase family protein, partial [Desulfobacteria bacterium]